MPNSVFVEDLDRIRPNLLSLAAERARSLPKFRYCDIRIQVREEKGGAAENGIEKYSSENVAFDFGVRTIAHERMSAAGYYGQVLGAADLDRIESVVWDGICQAHQRARSNARKKSQTWRRFPAVARSLDDTFLARVPVAEDTVPAAYEIDPRNVPLEETVQLAVDGCKEARGRARNVLFHRRFHQHLPAAGALCQFRGRRHRAGLRPDRRLHHGHLRQRARRLRTL